MSKVTSAVPPPLREPPTCRAAQTPREQAPRRDRAARRQGTAADVLSRLSRRAATFDRQPASTRATTLQAISKAVQEAVGNGLEEHAAEKVFESAWAGMGRAAVVHGAVGAAAAWYEGLKLGIEQINKAHRKAQAHGVNAHMARGLAQTLALAAKHPEASPAKLEATMVKRARRQYDAQAVTDRLRQGGRALDKDTVKRNERFEGLRRGIKLALRLVGSLSSEQRRALGAVAAKQGGGDIDEGFARLARPAVGADSIHARRR